MLNSDDSNEHSMRPSWCLGQNMYFISRCGYFCYVSVSYIFAGCKHVGVTCDVCRTSDFTGMRWKCMKCPDTDLCTQCYNEGSHCLDHDFLRIVSPDGLR